MTRVGRTVAVPKAEPDQPCWSIRNALPSFFGKRHPLDQPSGRISLARRYKYNNGLPATFQPNSALQAHLRRFSEEFRAPCEEQSPNARLRDSGVPKRGEQNDLADRAPAGEDHHQAVQPQTEAAGGRHPVLERSDEVLVEGLRLLVAGPAKILLLLEATPLLVGVVQLAERVRDLDSSNEALEALREPFAGAMRPRER